MLTVDRRWYALNNAYEDSPQMIGGPPCGDCLPTLFFL